MSRLVNLPVEVETDENSRPVSVLLPGHREPLMVADLGSYWVEWIGILQGEPEREIFQAKVGSGICELHCLRKHGDRSKPGDWVIHRLMD